MGNIIEKAKEYLSYQISVIPTKEDKRPLISWTPYQSKRMGAEEADRLFKGAQGVAILGGAVSGGLEIIDVDCKYDLTGSLWEELWGLVQDNLPVLFKSLVIAKTKKGGYHIYYRCSQIGGNTKLANRATIEAERERTYKREIEKGSTEEEAQRASLNDNIRVLVETRGEKGYVIAPPTPGYEYIQGDPGNIPTITTGQRDLILSISRSFNQVEETKETPAPQIGYGENPFEDYNNRGDVIGLLRSHGWRVISDRGDRVNLLRPGDTDSKTSGNYHKKLRVLRVFSTSTEFDSEKGYNPAQVFTLLECNGDYKIAYRKLLDMGYGEPFKKGQIKTDKITVYSVNTINKVTSVITSPGETLSIEKILGDEIVITSPGPEAQKEVLQAISLADETGKRIYIREGSKPEVRSYRYRFMALLEKYEGRELLDRDIDNLMAEIIETSIGIKNPVDRDLFKKLFLEHGSTLGISEVALSLAEEKLTTTREKEAQAEDFKRLLSEAKELQDKGETDKALELLDSKVKEVKAITTSGLLPPVMSFKTLQEEISTIPPAYKTGYLSLDKFVGFTPGAISLIAGRPSHGKTTLLYNLLLEMSRLYPGETFYYFTYEEPVKNLAIKLLNRLTATDLSGYYGDFRELVKPTNYELIKAYIKAGRTDIQEIEEGKKKLQELIDRGRIKIIDRNYSVEELYTLLAYLNKKEKIGAVLIDYIQRMRTERRTQDKRTEIAHISDQVLQIAKDSGLPIILGAQLNREATAKPRLENLKEAGNLEEDANTVISVYNDSREQEENSQGETYKGVKKVELELKVLKNREGEVNQVATLLFDKWTGVITDKETNPGYNPF